MAISIAIETPLQDDVRALVTELNAYLNPLSPPEFQFQMTVEQMADAKTTVFVARDDSGRAVGCGALKVESDELAEVKREFGLRFLHLGFNPLHRLDELPWIPKRRYPIMRKYLPTRGSRGLDMMQRTATVQANLDYSSEDDAMQKLVTLLRLTPVIAGMTK